jgi:hypothetical protein
LQRSPRHNWHVPTLLVLLAISMSLAFVGGCTSNAIAPENGKLDQTKLEWLNEFFNDGGASRGSGVDIKGCPVLFDTTLSQTVNQWGAQIDMIHGVEKIGFSLPYMAVKNQVTLKIRVTKYQAPFGEFWLLDCGPNGQTFNFPLYVQPNQHIINSSTAALFYYNPSTLLWEVQATSRSSNPQLPIYHFSKYGIS